ncbi:single-strand DNA-binding protein [Peptoniphilus asaccharolyticus DSM 20463]|uniref:Single-stranded DNA-binding protein n=1 Tax=Peptoniphilus asaccharolyticus DSM 20463 TaxID=573058 RepID=A0A1W1V1H0_PEPAS|nr:single-stranded DNA-binding protein [Peptoniphilus asaccharolyticus]MBL7575545.1 single-stranded DNA-binding protein [Peptoniphilus asaccharolyticus]SMB87207.1 single-strand DNA-binding protein [Peptoniphilus asaccharolyticus DSM 20463]
MNNVTLMGRLTREPELRYTSKNATAVVRFTLAVNRKLSKDKRADAERNNQPTADFISCIAWGKIAETIANYFKKGERIALAGHIQTGRYDDKDGKTVYTTDVVVESINFVEVKSDRDNEKIESENEGFYKINNEDIPF